MKISKRNDLIQVAVRKHEIRERENK